MINSKNEQGFGAVVLVMILAIVVVIGLVGWYVRSERDTGVNTTSTSTANEETESNDLYDFKELGISMKLLPGWKVKSLPSVEEGSNFYSWNIEKTGVGDSISLLSVGSRSEVEVCNPKLVKIVDVASSQNNSLTFIYWTAVTQNEGPASAKFEDLINIIKSDVAYFGTSYSNNALIGKIKSRELSYGNYYHCDDWSQPGFTLSLNKEVTPGFTRKDMISANINRADNSDELTNTQSYKDIKTMLTSIK